MLMSQQETHERTDIAFDLGFFGKGVGPHAVDGGSWPLRRCRPRFQVPNLEPEDSPSLAATPVVSTTDTTPELLGAPSQSRPLGRFHRLKLSLDAVAREPALR